MVPSKYEFLLIPSLVLLSLILGAISLLHFYWAVGGKWGFYEALPTKENGERLFIPKKIHSFIVGSGLLGIVGFVVFVLLKVINEGPYFLVIGKPVKYILIYLGIGIVFLIRAIGEFKYVGFFKKVKHTSFGKRDTKYFSPLSANSQIMIV